MSMLGRLAKGLGAAALTGNLGAGVVAALGNSFTAGTLAGISQNLLNSNGMNYGMQQYGYNPYGNMNNNMNNMGGGAITGCFGTGNNYGNNNNYGMNQSYNNNYNNSFDMGMQTGYQMGMQDAFNMNTGYNQFSPFNNGFNHNPVGYNMWTNPINMW